MFPIFRLCGAPQFLAPPEHFKAAVAPVASRWGVITVFPSQDQIRFAELGPIHLNEIGDKKFLFLARRIRDLELCVKKKWPQHLWSKSGLGLEVFQRDDLKRIRGFKGLNLTTTLKGVE
jgi:hypothetical protein